MSGKQVHGGGARTTARASIADGVATRRPFRTARTAMVGGLALGLTGAALVGLPAQAINSNPPSGPGNVEVFPMRDMVAIEGYAEQAGKTATIKVIRGTQVVGQTVGTVDASGFLEANHPGGVCWGVGTGAPQVTPDITAGDTIRVEFSDGNWDESKVVDVEATGVVLDEAKHTLTINGRYGPGVDMPGADLNADPGKFGIEIVNPEMRNGSAIGERAIGWPGHAPDPLDPEPVGGYTVDGAVTGTDATGGTFAATYTFQNADDLELANAGSITALGWLANHADPNQEAQYGLTLNEFYESGGPGMGGCPAGPTQVRTNGPGTYSSKGAGAGSIQVDWAAATPVPGSPAVSGYNVRAVTRDGVDEVGKRLDNKDARTTTITGLVPDEIYSIEITAKSAAGEGTPSIITQVRAADHVVPAATATTLRRANADGKYAPLVTGGNGDFGVHLDPVAGVLGAEVHYTTDGTTPTLKSKTFVSGSDDSIQIRQDTTLRWIVVDSGNIVGPLGQQFFDIIESTNPAPEITKVAAGSLGGTVDVTMKRLDDSTVTAYRVQAYTGASTDVASGVRVGTAVNVAQPASPDAAGNAVTEVVRRMTGLTNGTEYKFTVAALYGSAWSNESALSAAVKPEAPADANAGADQSVLRGRVVTLDGSASQKVTSYSWAQVRPAVTGSTYRDPIVTINGAETAKPTFQLPVKTSATSDDGAFQFRLTTTHTNPDGTTFTRADVVDIKEQKDAVAASRTRWRAGDRIVGTGSQENARLSFHSAPAGTVSSDPAARTKAFATAPVAVATVTGGQWTVPGTNAQPTGGKFYVWSNYGYVGEITVAP